MPSGAKKRKAAKKKKEKEANSYSLDGDDDPKVHDEKESDSGETNSPLSQDNHNNMHFAVGDDKRDEGTPPIQSAIIKSESVGVNGNEEISDKVAVEVKSSIQIDREIKLEDDSEPKAVNNNHIEKIEDISSSSSSDEESKFVGKNIEVINWEKPIEYAPNLPAESGGAVDLDKTSYLPEVTRVNEVVSHNLAVVTSNKESCEDVSAESPSSISVKPADLSEMNAVTKAIPVVDDHDLVIAKSKFEISDLVSETIPQVDPVILCKEEVHLDEDFGSKVNGKSEILEVPSSVIDIGSQSDVDILSTKATEDGEVAKIATVKEYESRTRPQSSIQVVNKVNGTEHEKKSEIESIDRQTTVALPPRPVQATSSMGCCGLFELFRGSNI